MISDDEYWSIDIPGLTHEVAVDIQQAFAPPRTGLGVILLDPGTFLVRAFDRSTVEILTRCLKMGLDSATLDRLDQLGAENLLDEMNSWLEQAQK